MSLTFIRIGNNGLKERRKKERRGSEQMISSQVLQNVVDELRAITRTDLCVMDLEGRTIAATFSDIGIPEETVGSFVNSVADSQVIQGYHFFKILDEHALEYILIARGASEDVYMIGKVAVSEIQNLIVAYKERFDKNNFIQNLLLDNLLLVDIYNRAKKLHIEVDARRIVFVIETKYEKDNAAMETVRSLFTAKTRDFITAVDEKSIILVKEVKEAKIILRWKRQRKCCWICSTQRRCQALKLHTEQ